MQILPPTGGGFGNPWIYSVRDNNGIHQFDVVNHEKNKGYEKAKEIIQKIQTANEAVETIKGLETQIKQYQIALSDAIRRPMGVVPDSAAHLEYSTPSQGKTHEY